MEVEVFISNLEQSFDGTSYEVVLEEEDLGRTLKIQIGPYEGLLIKKAMEGIQSRRPLTHDLFVSTLESLDAELSYVSIHHEEGGVYFAKLCIAIEKKYIEVDSRPSDAICIAELYGASIMVDDSLFSQSSKTRPSPKKENSLVNKAKESPLDSLELSLEKAIENEDYETAASLRDKIKNFKLNKKKK